MRTKTKEAGISLLGNSQRVLPPILELCLVVGVARMEPFRTKPDMLKHAARFALGVGLGPHLLKVYALSKTRMLLF